MKTLENDQAYDRAAHTLSEVILAIGLIAILCSLGFGAATRAKMLARTLVCASNLRQSGTSHHLFAADNSGLYSWQLDQRLGGSRGADFYFLHWIVLSNYLPDARVLVCPADKGRSPVRRMADLDSSRISYLLGRNATDTHPSDILSGDRHMNDSSYDSDSVREAAWADESSSQHRKGTGQLLLVDGSVAMTDDDELRSVIRASMSSTGVTNVDFLYPVGAVGTFP